MGASDDPAAADPTTEELQARIRELEARVESLGALASGAAHDFNNMLTVITGHADLMASGEREPSRAEHLASITEAAHRAGALCQQLLAYSGRGQFSTDVGRLADCVDADRLAADVGSPVAVDLPADLPEIDMAAAQLRELVTELVRNAVQASAEQGEGAPAIRISGRRDRIDEADLARAQFTNGLPAGEIVLLEIADHGPGVTEETKRRAFEPYFSTRVLGRGLGLSAVQGICRGHGAALWFDSTEGEGTTVRIGFPPAREASGGYRAREQARVRKVLVVDDEPGLLELAAAYCGELGIDAVTTDDPDQALELLLTQDNAIDAVILDYLMPLRTGDEVLGEIRGFSAVDVYLTSGFSQGILDDPELKQQLTGFLPKPFRMRDFERLLVHGDERPTHD